MSSHVSAHAAFSASIVQKDRCSIPQSQAPRQPVSALHALASISNELASTAPSALLFPPLTEPTPGIILGRDGLQARGAGRRTNEARLTDLVSPGENQEWTFELH